METTHISAPPLRVHGDELADLVARLQSHSPPDATTTADVAAALGLSESEVASVLRSMREQSAVPVLAAATAPARAVRGRSRRVGAAVGISVIALVALVIGRASAPHRFISGPYMTVSAAGGIRDFLPKGVTVQVGDLVYRGSGRVPISEDMLAIKVREAVARAHGPVVGGTVNVAKVRQQLTMAQPTGAEALEFVPVKVFQNGSLAYSTSVPVASTDIEMASGDLGREVSDAAESRIASTANRIMDAAGAAGSAAPSVLTRVPR